MCICMYMTPHTCACGTRRSTRAPKTLHWTHVTTHKYLMNNIIHHRFAFGTVQPTRAPKLLHWTHMTTHKYLMNNIIRMYTSQIRIWDCSTNTCSKTLALDTGSGFTATGLSLNGYESRPWSLYVDEAGLLYIGMHSCIHAYIHTYYL